MRLPVVTLLCLAVLAPSAAQAVGATQELLESPRVRRFIRVSVPAENGQPLSYTLDDRTGPKQPGADPVSVVASDQVDFVVSDFNPLTMDVSAVDGAEPDPSFKQLADFLDKLGAIFKPLDVPDPTGLSTTALARAAGASEGQTKRQAPPEDICPAAATVREQLVEWHNTLVAAAPAPAAMEKWTRDAVGRQGISNVAAAVSAEAASVEKRRQKAAAALEQLRQRECEYGLRQCNGAAAVSSFFRREDLDAMRRAFQAVAAKEDRDRDKPEALAAEANELVAATALRAQACRDLVVGLLVVFERTDPDDTLARVDALHDGLQALSDSLEKLASNPDNWHPRDAADTKDRVFHRRGVQPDKVSIVTVNAQRLRYDVKDGRLTRETVADSQVKFVARLRQYTKFASETAAGAVFALLRVPSYGTGKNDAGETIVTLGERKEYDFKGALLFNAVCRCWGKSPFYPMLQLGAATHDGVPALLFGGGLRIFGAKGLGVAGGAVLAFVKDLDKLTPGVSKVSGTADIEADLKHRVTVKPYFAIQYSF